MNCNKVTVVNDQLLNRLRMVNEFLQWANEGRQIWLTPNQKGLMMVWETISSSPALNTIDTKTVPVKLVSPSYREIDNEKMYFGGTMALVYGQLTRYILGHSHYGIAPVASRMYGLRRLEGGEKRVAEIKAALPEFYTDFQNAADLACVLCGRAIPEWESNFDWWTDTDTDTDTGARAGMKNKNKNKKHKTGPCHQYGECEKY